MPSIINSDDGVVSGSSGLKSTGGNDGILVFQKNGTETARINTDNQLVVAAGTVSLPVIAPTGDLNTGVFFPAADTIAFTEGGTEVLRINSSGNVGIGTTTPAVKLDVNGAITASGAVTAGGALQASGVTTNIYPIVSGTAQNITGSGVGFTGIPSWVKRITVSFRAVSLTGTENILVQIGSGSYTATGYVSTSGIFTTGGATNAANSTSGFVMLANAATDAVSGHMLLTNITGNEWVSSHSAKRGTLTVMVGSGDVTIGGAVDRLQIIPSGTNTFDAGTVNIFYE